MINLDLNTLAVESFQTVAGDPTTWLAADGIIVTDRCLAMDVQAMGPTPTCPSETGPCCFPTL